MIKYDTLDSSSKLTLVIDVGTGTQDVFLSGLSKDVENSPQMILPSPTVLIGRQIEQAAAMRQGVFLSGYTMGGGPSSMAVKGALKNGVKISATADAAKTLDDDLDKVRSLGIDIAVAKPDNFIEVQLTDVMFAPLADAFKLFGMDIAGCDLAIAVQDHGEAPQGQSDRKFRFEYLAKHIADGTLLQSIYTTENVPEYLTRFKSALAASPVATYVMDTGVAAILGALEDPVVGEADNKLIVNIGNGHTLAVSMIGDKVVGLFEHHTSGLTGDKLDNFIHELLDGRITNLGVFDDGGHGAHVVEGIPIDSLLAVTGPRRGLIRNSRFRPYFAAPYGDMMLSGCFGLIRALKNIK